MADASSPVEALRDLAPSTRSLLMSVLRATLGTALLLLAYAMLPLDPDSVAIVPFLIVLVGLAAFVALFVRVLSAVSRAENPGLKGLETLAFASTFFVVVFATAYTVLSQSSADAFGEALSKVDAIYFTVTVLATVGFGDISAASASARIMVTVQMVLDLVLIGVAVRLLFSTAKAAAARKRARTGA